MARARAGAGPDQHLVRLAGGDDLVHERVDGRAAAVDDALSADLDHGCVRQDSEVRRLVRLRLQLRVGQRSLHQERFELRRGAGHGILPLAAGSHARVGAGVQALWRRFPLAEANAARFRGFASLRYGRARRELGVQLATFGRRLAGVF